MSTNRVASIVATAALALISWESTLSAQAPEKGPLAGDRMFETYLAAESDRLAGRVLDGASTRDEWEARRPRLHRELLDMLGLRPLPEKTPLHARVTGTLERPGDVVVEKLHFQSRPGLYVTGNLYRPRAVEGRLPAVLYVCGHSARGRDGNKTAFQDHGMWFARNGYVALLIDTLQLGEVAGVHHGTYNRDRWWWQAAGYTPAGVECWNGIRAIDYLVSRPDVDPDRIAVTGISGGGATTIWIAAADDRVRCAVPVSGMSDLESYVNHKVINGHCDCMLFDNLYGWEWTTIAALIAPRPLLFANSDTDAGFPMDGNRRIIARLRRLYALYDKPALVDDHVSHGGHDYRPDLRLAVFRWINLHVKGDSGPVRDAEDPPVAGAELRVFPDDKDLPADSVNDRIDESFVARGEPGLPAEGRFAAWKADLLAKLHDRIFRRFPDRVPAAVASSSGERSSALRTLTTEPGIEVTIRDLRSGTGPGTLIVLNPGEDLGTLPEWAKPVVAEGTAVLLAPRGVGPTAWTRRSPPNYVERAHVLVGRTVDEGRAWDVAATLGRLDADSGRTGRWTLAGARQAGVLAALATHWGPPVARVTVVDPPATFRDGPFLLGVLRVLDVPQALGLLAPSPLTLIGARGAAFDATATLYERADARDELNRP